MVTVAGDYEPDALARAVQEVQADPGYHPGLSMLYDARRCEANIDRRMVEDWVRKVAGLPKLGFSRRCAIVMSSEHRYRFGMARVAAAHLAPKGVDLMVTMDFDEAVAGLTRAGL